MVDFDKYGHCCFCHKNMTIEEVIDNKVQIRFTPEYSEEELLLDNGSRMRIAICIYCKEKLTENDFNKVMDCVIKGWEKELEQSKWDKEKKEKYRKDYYGLKIVTKSAGKNKEELDKELKKFKIKDK